MGYNASGSKTRKTARPKVLPAISYSRNGHTQKYAFAPAYCRKSQTAADRNRNQYIKDALIPLKSGAPSHT